MYAHYVVPKVYGSSNYWVMKVSIIVPIYNIESCISYCVESLVNQDYKNKEIILVDDGSTDKSLEKCNIFSDKYDCIKVVHKLNGGLSSARNAGLDVATGDYIIFIDGDDYFQYGAIATLVEIAERTGADVIQFGYEEVLGYDKYKTIKKIKICDGPLQIETDRHTYYENLYTLGGVAASACTKFMRLNLVQRLRFKEGIFHEDEQFTTRLLAICNSMVYVNDFLPYKYVMRDGSIIHAFNAKRITDISEIMEERIDYLKELKFQDLVNITASKYFGNLILFYVQARLANNKSIYGFIDKKAKFLVNNYRLNLSVVNKVLAYLYRVGLSGASFYYFLRKFVGK